MSIIQIRKAQVLSDVPSTTPSLPLIQGNASFVPKIYNSPGLISELNSTSKSIIVTPNGIEVVAVSLNGILRFDSLTSTFDTEGFRIQDVSSDPTFLISKRIVESTIQAPDYGQFRTKQIPGGSTLSVSFIRPQLSSANEWSELIPVRTIRNSTINRFHRGPNFNWYAPILNLGTTNANQRIWEQRFNANAYISRQQAEIRSRGGPIWNGYYFIYQSDYVGGWRPFQNRNPTGLSLLYGGGPRPSGATLIYAWLYTFAEIGAEYPTSPNWITWLANHPRDLPDIVPFRVWRMPDNSLMGQIRINLPIQWRVRTLSVTQYSSSGFLNNDRTQIPVSQDPPILMNLDFEMKERAERVFVTVLNSTSELLKTFTVKLPRSFNNKASTIYALDGIAPQSISIIGRGKEIDVPSNAIENNDEPFNEYLTFPSFWNKTFKKLRTRDPVWILRWILTDEIFRIGLTDDQLDLDSFYSASVYGQELVNGEPRWCYDGLLSGSSEKIINDVLESIGSGSVLSNNTDGKYFLEIERPTESKWIISPSCVLNAQIKYKTAVSKVGIRAKYIALAGNEIITPEKEPNERIIDIPFQSPSVAERWALWRSFEEKNLLDTVNFQLSFLVSNNEGSVANYFKMKLYDVIEIYDPLISGQIMSGRVLESTRTSIRVQELPSQLLDNLTLKIQLLDGGIQRIVVKNVNVLEKIIEFDEREIIPIGSVFSLEHPRLFPRKFRILSIVEKDNGVSYSITARPYYDNMHEHIERGTDLVLPPFIYISSCGVNVRDFLGLASNVHQRYSVSFDSVVDLKIDEWNTRIDDMGGLVSNLKNSCDLPEVL